jgi:anti-sigma B factor antagonist
MFVYELRASTGRRSGFRSDQLRRYTAAARVSDRPPEPFRCDIEPSHGKVHVIPRGEIDLATAPVLEGQLRELRDTGFDHLVVDLRDVTFMDSTGLRLILGWDDEARAGGLDFELIPGAPIVQRLFEITGVTDRLRFVAPPG